MKDWIPILVLVHLVVPTAGVVIGRIGRAQIEGNTATFRIYPAVAWFLTLCGFGASIAFGLVAIIYHANPTVIDILPELMGSIAFFVLGLYGIYLVTLRIEVDERDLRVTSTFGRRVTLLSNIGSATDSKTGKYRTFDVFDGRRRRVLYVTSTFLPDYDYLVTRVTEGKEDAMHALRNTNRR